MEKRARLTYLTIAAAALLICPGMSGAKERAKIRANFAQTGIDGDASGLIKASLRDSKADVKIAARGLNANAAYTLVVGGITEASGTASSSGRLAFRFRVPARGSSALLEFDPRGKLVAINDGTGDVLDVVASGTGEPSDIKVDDRTNLTPTALAPGGKAEARFRLKAGRSRFKVEIEDVPAGDYDVFVDGVLRGTIVLVAGDAQIEFDTNLEAGKLPLDFDPRGLVIDIVQGTDVFFSGTMAEQSTGVTSCAFQEAESPLVSTGADPDASGKARFRIRDDCDQDFRVEIQDVPEGDYTLLVDGVDRGTITVVDTGTKIEGQIEFDTDPDDPGELLLDFDPRDALIEIAQGITTFFSNVFDGTVPGGGSSCTPEETQLPIASTGADPDGSADARFRVRDDCDQDFRVEIQDVPEGDYTLLVDGTDRGTITVVDDGIDVRGQIEFDTDPNEPGELLLTFDPRGALIEVVQGATTFFSDVFGEGGGGGPSVCQPTETEVPLLNTGVDANAKGKARFRERDDCDTDFRVEIEKLPEGDYTLLVDGTDRGTITVAFNPAQGENEGRIDFDSDPDQPGEELLDFDPRGALIEIEQGGTVYLDRAFPDA